MRYLNTLVDETKSENQDGMLKVVEDIISHEYSTPELNEMIATLSSLTRGETFDYRSINKSINENMDIIDNHLENLSEIQLMEEEYESIDMSLYPEGDERLLNITMSKMKIEESIEVLRKEHESSKCKIMILSAFLIKGFPEKSKNILPILDFLQEVDSFFEKAA